MDIQPAQMATLFSGKKKFRELSKIFICLGNTLLCLIPKFLADSDSTLFTRWLGHQPLEEDKQHENVNVIMCLCYL